MPVCLNWKLNGGQFMFKIWKWFKSQLQRVNGYIHQCPIQTKLHEKHHQRYCNVISPGFTVGRVLAFGYAEGFKPSGNSSPWLNQPKKNYDTLFLEDPTTEEWGLQVREKIWLEHFLRTLCKISPMRLQHTSQNKKNSLCCNRCFFIIAQSPSCSPRYPVSMYLPQDTLVQYLTHR